MRSIVIIGAGGLARAAADAIGSINARAPTWDLHGYLDDDPLLDAAVIDGRPVIGPTPLLRALVALHVVVATDDTVLPSGDRLEVVGRLHIEPDRCPPIVHPDTSIGSDAHIGPGCVLLRGTVVGPGTSVGPYSAVFPNAALGVDDVIEAGVTIGAGAMVGNAVSIGRGSSIGAGAVVRDGVSIGDGAVVGIGAVVLHDVPTRQAWAGNPARPGETAPIPLDARREFGLPSGPPPVVGPAVAEHRTEVPRWR